MENKVILQIPGYRCSRCGHEWIPRIDQYPTLCPKCKSPYWDKPKKINNEDKDNARTSN